MPDTKSARSALFRRAALACAAAGLGFAVGRSGCVPQARDSAPPAAPDTARGAWRKATSRAQHPVDRAQRVAGLLGTLTAADAPGAAAALAEHQDEWTEYETRLLVWAWARLDPAAAFTAALSGPAYQRDATSYAVARAWARVNPIEATETVRAQLESADNRLSASLMTGLAQGKIEHGDFAEVTDFIRERFKGLLQRETLLENLVEEMYRVSGRAAVIVWAEGLAAEEKELSFLSVVFRKAARVGAREHPVETANWLDRFEGDPRYMDRARRAAAVVWGQADAPSALAWIHEHPSDSARRRDAFVSVLVDWAARDAVAAFAWLSGAPSDPDLEPAIAAAAERIAVREPESALAWTDRIQDAGQRQQAQLRVGRRWFAKDPAAASAWLDRTGASAPFRKFVSEAPAKPARPAAGAPARPAFPTPH